MERDLSTIWHALQCYREDCISTDDEAWDEVCEAMAHIHEALDIPQEDIE